MSARGSSQDNLPEVEISRPECANIKSQIVFPDACRSTAKCSRADRTAFCSEIISPRENSTFIVAAQILQVLNRPRRRPRSGELRQRGNNCARKYIFVNPRISDQPATISAHKL